MANAFLDLNNTPSLVSLNGRNLIIGCDTNGSLIFTNNGAYMKHAYSSQNYNVTLGTASGVDDQAIKIGPAGVATSSRCATMELYGANHASTPGNAYFGSAAVTGSVLFIDGNGGTGYPVSIRTSATAGGSLLRRWGVDGNGDFGQDSTNGGSIAFAKADTGVLNTVGNGLTAAGTTIADALQLSSIVNNFGTVASGAGAKLSDSVRSGLLVYVRNGGANALLLYPPNASGTINGGSTGAAVSIAATEVAVFVKVVANTWVGGVMVAF